MSRQMAGFKAWVLQRISAVYLGLFMPFALLYLLLSPPTSYADWLKSINNPWVFISVFLFSLAAFIHAWIGIRDIVIDYVKPPGARLILLVMIAAFLTMAGIWMAKILFSAVSII